MDEILLSQSNLERVWMDEGWNTRVELTELGEWYQALRAMRFEAQKTRRVWPAVAAASGVAAVVTTIAWRLIG